MVSTAGGEAMAGALGREAAELHPAAMAGTISASATDVNGRDRRDTLGHDTAGDPGTRGRQRRVRR